MKRQFLSIITIAATSAMWAGVEVTNTTLQHASDDMAVAMNIKLHSLKVPSNRALVLTRG